MMIWSNYIPIWIIVVATFVLSSEQGVGVDNDLVSVKDYGDCSQFFEIDVPISLSSCNTDFEQCYLSGYSDDYLCEGCSLVSQGQDNFVDDTDVDCVCTCCWFQYLQNYCFKQLCSDSNEYQRLVQYTSSICQNRPKRFLKPYIPDSGLYDEDPILRADNIDLFSSDDNTLYRSLLKDEKDFLFTKLTTVFDIRSIKQGNEEEEREREDIEGVEAEFETNDEDAEGKYDEGEIIFESINDEGDKVEGSELDVETEEGYNIFDFLENDTKQYEKRSIDKDLLKIALTGDIQAFVDFKDEVTYETIQDIFESYVEQPDDFFAAARALLGQAKFDVFYGAFQESSDIIRAESVDVAPDTYCLEYDVKSIGTFLSDNPAIEENLEVTGCYVSTIINAYERGLCPSSGHCSCKCAAVKGLKQCAESYAKNLEGLLAYVTEDISVLCEPIVKDTIDPLNLDETHYEERVEEYFSFLSNLGTVADTLNFGDVLAEFKSKLLWETSTSDHFHDSEDVSVAIVVDKCELEKNDLLNYFQFDLDSCDIRDLYYCKNHYKGNECRAFQEDSNVCNSACCLQIKMAKCASTHCKSKKALKEFKAIANLICTKYSDPHVIDGLPFPEEDEDDYDDSQAPTSTFEKTSDSIEETTSSEEPTEATLTLDDGDNNNGRSQECGESEYSTRPVADRTDLFPEKRDLITSFYEPDSTRTNYYDPDQSRTTEAPKSRKYLEGNDGEEQDKSKEDQGENRPPLQRTNLAHERRDINDVSELDSEDGGDLGIDEITAQIKFGDTSNDKKAFLSRSICEIEEFKPPYDTTQCDKREVKDCIKEGIQALRDDPKHFCPYCVNDNAYDECRCACCFGKYFSKVCYDPHCKGLKEKLRYKRYVKEVCKTKPRKRGYIHARDEDYDGKYVDVHGKSRFKTPTGSFPSLEDVNLNVVNLFDGFDDQRANNDNDRTETPVNLKEGLLNSMKKSLLRKSSHYKRKEEEEDVTENDGNGDFSLKRKSNSLTEGKGKYRRAKSYAKTGSIEKKPKRVVSAFSPADRKLKGAVDFEDIDVPRRAKFTKKKKKKTTGPHKSTKRRSSRRRKSKQQIKVLPVDSQRLEVENKIEERQKQIDQLHSDIVPHKKSISKSRNGNVYKRDVLYKLSAPKVMNEKVKADYFSSSNIFFNASTEISSRKYKTVTKTYTRTKSKSSSPVTRTTSSPTASNTTPKSNFPPANLGQSALSSPRPLKTANVTVSATENITSTTHFRTITETANEAETKSRTAAKTPLSTASPNATITSQLIQVQFVPTTATTTDTTTKTKIHPTTEFKTEFEKASTLTTPYYDDTFTVTIPKTTLYRDKYTSVTSETAELTKTKTRTIPPTTFTGDEESNESVTELVPKRETETETLVEEVAATTAVSYSVTTTATRYKLTVTKFESIGTVTTTSISITTERSIQTKWYPEFTVTEFEEQVTSTKTKWYPYPSTATATETSISTQTFLKAGRFSSTVAQVPNDRIAPTLKAREDDKDDVTEIDKIEDFRSFNDLLFADETEDSFQLLKEDYSKGYLEENDEIIEDITELNQTNRINGTIGHSNETAVQSGGSRPTINHITLASIVSALVLVALTFFVLEPVNERVDPTANIATNN